jgi:AcrR family transcriptional regulator
VPKLWSETVQTHRQEVREAILDAAGKLVLDRGLLGVTMSDIAEATGIGRATLYKYFSDVEEILSAWHQRQVLGHLAELEAIRDRTRDPAERMRAVLQAYAHICRQRRRHGGDELTVALHRGPAVRRLQSRLLELMTGVIAGAADAGLIRQDVPARELANYCIHALGAAATSSTSTVARLVDLVCAGMTSRTRAQELAASKDPGIGSAGVPAVDKPTDHA